MNSVVTLTIIILCFKNYIRCNVDDYVTADVEILPPFETIIVSDLADVINEFNDNLKSGFDSNVYNDSDEKESIDELVSNYQTFLDKKHKHRMNIKETASNLPKYTRTFSKYQSSKDLKFPRNLNRFVSDSFYPYKNKILRKSDRHPKITSLLNTLDTCNCEDNVFPCKCNSDFNTNSYEPYFKDEANDDLNKDNLNININVELKMDDFIETLTSILSKIFVGDKREESFGAKDQKHNPFLNFFSMRSFNNNNSHIILPNKKVSFYKKKARHSNKVGRRHKNKNHLSINSLDDDALLKTKFTTDKNTTSPSIKDIINTDKNSTLKNVNSSLHSFQKLEINNIVNKEHMTTVNVNKIENSTGSTGEKILKASYVVIRNNTEDFQSLGNSIEKFDGAKTEPIKTRNRRQTKPVKYVPEVNEDYKLLYWPPYNSSNDSITSIGVLSIQKEQKELNVTNKKILSNVSVAIDKEIFNETNWKDVNSIARQFVFFVGKHLNGMLTLCSEDVCHSINCANKVCLERICEPQERFNAKGHCTAKLSADTVAPVSVIDVPTTKAFKLIDDLKTKMAGKLFGKATLCETQKCVTFVATDKAFLKSDCTSKELAKGHSIHKMM
ncbi:asparagine-rich protein-like isoform X2 [Aricia agestis]|uniref:asparagine-rich protein-like isoform X2 n=1 Tax=Aricia agestis TaxID=91739 RepID=UPI001C201D05|nr:asparagine-rich protein-like isoform X2 [Aricia agestis]